MPAHLNVARHRHPRTPTLFSLILSALLLSILPRSSTQLPLPPRRLNTTKMRSKTRNIKTLPRMGFRTLHMHWVYLPFSHLNAAIAGRVYTRYLAPPWASLNSPSRDCDNPRVPSRQPNHHLPFLLVLSVLKGNSSTTKALIVTQSIPRERYLNSRVSPIRCGASEMLTSVLRSRSKKRKIEYTDCPTHKRLGDIKAMHRRERDREIEGVKLPEAISLAARRRMPVWSPSSSPIRNLLDGEVPNRSN
jgi:hypothetical protein